MHTPHERNQFTRKATTTKETTRISDGGRRPLGGFGGVYKDWRERRTKKWWYGEHYSSQRLAKGETGD